MQDALNTGCPSLLSLGYAIIRPDDVPPNFGQTHYALTTKEEYAIAEYNWEGISASQQLHNNRLSCLASSVTISKEKRKSRNPDRLIYMRKCNALHKEYQDTALKILNKTNGIGDYSVARDQVYIRTKRAAVVHIQPDQLFLVPPQIPHFDFEHPSFVLLIVLKDNTVPTCIVDMENTYGITFSKWKNMVSSPEENAEELKQAFPLNHPIWWPGAKNTNPRSLSLIKDVQLKEGDFILFDARCLHYGPGLMEEYEDWLVSFTLLTPIETQLDQYNPDTQQHIFHLFKRIYTDPLHDQVPLDLQLTVHDLNSAWTAQQQIRLGDNTVFAQFYPQWHRSWEVSRRREDILKKIPKKKQIKNYQL